MTLFMFLLILIIVAVIFFTQIKGIGCCEDCIDDDCRECFRKRINAEENGGEDSDDNNSNGEE